MSNHNAVDGNMTRGGLNALGEIHLVIGDYGHIAAACHDGVVHLHITSIARAAGNQSDATTAGGNVARGREVASQ